MRRIPALLLMLLLPGLLLAQTRANSPSRPLVLRHVTVIDVTRGRAKSDMTVMIEGGHINALGRGHRIKVPPGSQVIDATGKYLIPGLWDMHVHEWNKEVLFPLFIAHGITGVRDMFAPLAPIKQKMRPSVYPHTAVLLFLLTASFNVQAQCNRIDKKLPDFFITFERVVTAAKSPEGKDYRTKALLRLRNNTNCTVILPSNDEGPSPQLQKLRHRDQTLKRTDALTDGQQLSLVYSLNNERGANGTISVSDGCLVYERSLATRESVLFSVPIIHFKKGADVAVQFRYASEDEHVSLIGGEFGHYVFFRNDSLPKESAQR